MKRNKIKTREQLVYLSWLALDVTMEDLGDIYSMSTTNVHRCIKEWRDKDIELFRFKVGKLIKKLR